MDIQVRRALLSVFDKTGIVELARTLQQAGVELLSTGSTARHLADAGVAVTPVEDATGFPEVLGGRVKTLHPAIHAGVLADRGKPDHLRQLDELGIAPIDLVVVNLYAFAAAVRGGADASEAVEMIDIGGPTLLRAAAKNHAGVAVLCRPDQYPAFARRFVDGAVTAAHRRELAAAAFDHVTAYDVDISRWLHRDEPFPPHLHLSWERAQELRYGENPHQQAAFYRAPAVEPDARGMLADATQLHGKELSYNNLLDTGAAVLMAAEFQRPCVAIVKHANPAGLAVSDDLAVAYARALEGDPVSAFGGIVASNRAVDRATADGIAGVFTEVVAAPAFTPEAQEVLQTKRNLRLLAVPGLARPAAPGHELRSVPGGLLVQASDTSPDPQDEWRVVTRAQPDAALWRDLAFVWRAAKHVRSNAIALASDERLVGVGAGQMSRVDAVHLAVTKSNGRHVGAVLGSDAFFPFRDGPDAAAAAGVRAIIQPGGSVRDDEVIEAADEHGMVMVLTGRRHFRH